MDDWYKASGLNFKQDQLLDELMCEYVDGTMDPSVQSAFDELISSNPTIAKQVEGLTEAQSILKQTGCSLCAPRQFQTRLRARLDAETGKIHVYGLPDSSHWQPGAFARHSLLIAIFVWAGLALPRHDSLTPNYQISGSEEVAAAAPLEIVTMTPARKPFNVPAQYLIESDNAISFSAVSRSSESDFEADGFELTLLGD